MPSRRRMGWGARSGVDTGPVARLPRLRGRGAGGRRGDRGRGRGAGASCDVAPRIRRRERTCRAGRRGPVRGGCNVRRAHRGTRSRPRGGAVMAPLARFDRGARGVLPRSLVRRRQPRGSRRRERPGGVRGLGQQERARAARRRPRRACARCRGGRGSGRVVRLRHAQHPGHRDLVGRPVERRRPGSRPTGRRSGGQRDRHGGRLDHGLGAFGCHSRLGGQRRGGPGRSSRDGSRGGHPSSGGAREHRCLDCRGHVPRRGVGHALDAGAVRGVRCRAASGRRALGPCDVAPASPSGTTRLARALPPRMPGIERARPGSPPANATQPPPCSAKRRSSPPTWAPFH